MKRIILILLVCFCFLSTLNAQETPSKENTLESQFDNVIDKSNSYQDFKVIKKVQINQLKKNVLDTLIVLDEKMRSIAATVQEQSNEIDSLKGVLQNTQNDLAASKQKEDGIYLFGMLLSKTSYNVLLWSIILILLLLLGFFMMKFKRSNAVTREANSKLLETEAEFEAHRSRALEREQQLRRKLQDELNKNKKA
jgi:septal ring factor EnvC (AmiA/AmiB activator)